MRIAHLNTFDTKGGAARAALRVHSGLCSLGADSTLFVSQRSGRGTTAESKIEVIADDSAVGRLQQRYKFFRSQRAIAPYRPASRANSDLFSTDRGSQGAALARRISEFDIVNLHWIAGFVDYRGFFENLGAKPRLVWTLHDMNPFTGGCHYDGSCGRFSNRCGKCPELASTIEDDLSRKTLERKLRALATIDSNRLHIVSPSRWLAQEAGRSGLMGRFARSVIPNGIDLERFCPMDRLACRSVLRIPADAKVVLFVADAVALERKGFTQLVGALEGLSGISKLFVLVLGTTNAELRTSVPVLQLGSLDNDRLLPAVYGAADLFVIPSLRDNFPNTVVEAMACGVAVVGFAAGGIADLVRHGETGLLAPVGDSGALRKNIAAVLGDEPMRLRFASAARNYAVAEYGLERQARAYLELYHRLCGFGGKPS